MIQKVGSTPTRVTQPNPARSVTPHELPKFRNVSKHWVNGIAIRSSSGHGSKTEPDQTETTCTAVLQPIDFTTLVPALRRKMMPYSMTQEWTLWHHQPNLRMFIFHTQKRPVRISRYPAQSVKLLLVLPNISYNQFFWLLNDLVSLALDHSWNRGGK